MLSGQRRGPAAATPRACPALAGWNPLGNSISPSNPPPECQKCVAIEWNARDVYRAIRSFSQLGRTRVEEDLRVQCHSWVLLVEFRSCWSAVLRKSSRKDSQWLLGIVRTCCFAIAIDGVKWWRLVDDVSEYLAIRSPFYRMWSGRAAQICRVSVVVLGEKSGYPHHQTAWNIQNILSQQKTNRNRWRLFSRS